MISLIFEDGNKTIEKRLLNSQTGSHYVEYLHGDDWLANLHSAGELDKWGEFALELEKANYDNSLYVLLLEDRGGISKPLTVAKGMARIDFKNNDVIKKCFLRYKNLNGNWTSMSTLHQSASDLMAIDDAETKGGKTIFEIDTNDEIAKFANDLTVGNYSFHLLLSRMRSCLDMVRDCGLGNLELWEYTARGIVLSEIVSSEIALADIITLDRLKSLFYQYPNIHDMIIPVLVYVGVLFSSVPAEDELNTIRRYDIYDNGIYLPNTRRFVELDESLVDMVRKVANSRIYIATEPGEVDEPLIESQYLIRQVEGPRTQPTSASYSNSYGKFVKARDYIVNNIPELEKLTVTNIRNAGMVNMYRLLMEEGYDDKIAGFKTLQYYGEFQFYQGKDGEKPSTVNINNDTRLSRLKRTVQNYTQD